MTVIRDRPYERSYFLVDLGGGREASPFRAVHLPVATTDVVISRSGSDRQLEPRKHPGLVSYSNLTLVRELCGHTDLYEWWEQVRAGDEDVHRSVTVHLLDERRDQVWAWRFTDAFPATYRFSAVEGDSSQPVDEILELAFTRMSIE